LGSLLLYFLRTDIPHVAAIWYPAWYLLYFVAGALLPQTAKAVVARPGAWLVGSAIVFALAEYSLQRWGGPQSDPFVSAANIVTASAGITATIALSTFLAHLSFGFGAYLGRMSLQVYLLHTTAAGFTRIVLQKILGVQDLYVHLLLGTLVGIGAPLAVAYLIERYRIPGLFSAPRRLQLPLRRAPA
jgi:peptidoglycan/LPS O-acetylase OafA/YrhL